jgi:RecB family endonuclease NucS
VTDSETDGSGAGEASAASGVETLVDPTAEAAHALLARRLDGDALVTVYGRCTVEYDGRASSSLGPGDRLVVLKPDGTALVHTTENQKPVNWQPPGCTHEVSVSDGRLRLRSERSTPSEELLIEFETSASASSPTRTSWSRDSRRWRPNARRAPARWTSSARTGRAGRWCWS